MFRINDGGGSIKKSKQSQYLFKGVNICRNGSCIFVKFRTECGGQLAPNYPPIGTIVAWSGNLAFLPDNWKVCDGTAYPKDRYKDLYQIVATYWTNDEGINKDLFNIPNLQGMFLRGVNGIRNDEYADEDINARKNLLNKKSRDVGSFQLDEFESHNHPPLNSKNFGVQGPGGLALGNQHSKAAPTTGNRGGNETRPKNAYVYWIIKVK